MTINIRISISRRVRIRQRCLARLKHNLCHMELSMLQGTALSKQDEAMREDERETERNLIEGLWNLRALAIQLDLNVVGALIKVAIGLIPTSIH